MKINIEKHNNSVRLKYLKQTHVCWSIMKESFCILEDYLTCLSVNVGVSLSVVSYRPWISPSISNNAPQTRFLTRGGISTRASFQMWARLYGYAFSSLSYNINRWNCNIYGKANMSLIKTLNRQYMSFLWSLWTTSQVTFAHLTQKIESMATSDGIHIFAFTFGWEWLQTHF